MIKKLMQKWEVSGYWQFFLILLTFACAGISVVRLKKPIFQLLDIQQYSDSWLFVVLYLLIMFPSYQILLLLFAFLFGQFSFFWKKEKKLLQRLKILKKTKSLYEP